MSASRPTQWNALTTDDHNPLLNKALSGVYPPGSTFKPAMALRRDATTGSPICRSFCTGSITLGNHVFHCWKKGGHGHVDLHKGIQQSCDVFFYEVAKRLGIDKMARRRAQARPRRKSPASKFPASARASSRAREWKLKRLTACPGSRAKRSSPASGRAMCWRRRIQLCTLAARIASGNAVSPRITRVVGHTRRSRARRSTRCRSPTRRSPAVQAGMNAVTNEPGGTAYAWRIPEPGFEMAGKTGTAQVRRHHARRTRDAA